MIDWIRDAETGELLPIETDINFDPPAHLEIPEYTTIDYDKTTKMTIEELQNQLIAAQNYIEAIESEKTSDNNSAVTVNEASPDIVSESGFKKDLNDWYPLIILILVCTAVAVFGLLFFRDDIKESFQNVSEYQTVDYEVTQTPKNVSIPYHEQSEP